MNRWQKLFSVHRRYRERLGWAAATQLQTMEYLAYRHVPLRPRTKLRPRGARQSIHLRTGRSSDFQVFKQIFVDEEYGCLLDIRTPSLILDLGANVGCSSVWFLSMFPASKVIAVEPDPANADLCEMNLAPFGARASVLRGAVWHTCTRLALSRGSFEDGREWATQVVEASEPTAATVQTWDVVSLLELAHASYVDLMKIDIERSEIELFSRHTETWLPRVRNICIELHGSDCEAAFFEALSGYEFELSGSGELTICRNLRRKPSV